MELMLVDDDNWDADCMERPDDYDEDLTINYTNFVQYI